MPPDHCVANLQEELVSVKMREAEANLSLKEMRQRLGEIEQQWAVSATKTTQINAIFSTEIRQRSLRGGCAEEGGDYQFRLRSTRCHCEHVRV